MSAPAGRRVDIGDDLSLHIHDLGSGAPVVFLHGSGPGASAWSNFGPNAIAIAEAGFRPILVDSLGYGQSSKPETAEYDLEFMSGGVVRMLDSLGLVVQAGTGDDALEVVRAGETLHLALLDMKMPGRGGYEVFGVLRERGRRDGERR